MKPAGKFFLLVFLATSAVSSFLPAQDIDLIGPRTEIVDPLDDDPVISSTEEDEPVTGSAQSVGTVRGIRIVATPGEVAVDNPPTTVGVVVVSETLVVPDQVKEALAEFVGGPLSLLSVNQMSRATVLAYRETGMPVVDVAFPEQNVSNGVLQLVVVLGRRGTVSVEGNQWFKENVYLRSFRVPEGGVLYEAPILDDLNYLNRNPYRSVSLAYTPGNDFGDTDVVLQANERRPWMAYAGYEDTGNQFIGEDRLLFGFDWGNVLGLDHRAAYQYTTTPDFDRIHAHALTYTIPFWRTRHELRMLFGYVETDVDFLLAGVPFVSGGESSQISLEYAIPLPELWGYEHEIAAGFDFKSTNNNLEFGGLTVTDSTAEIHQFAIAETFSKDLASGRQYFRHRLVWSPGDLSPHNTDAAFQPLRALSSAEYVYWAGEFSQSVNLPAGFLLVAEVDAHLSDSNLLPSETLILGGIGSVRGFEQNITRADRGVRGSVELYGPAFRPLGLAGIEGVQEQGRLFAFYDHAFGSNIDLLPGEADNIELGGAGLGMEVKLTRHSSIRVTHGWQTAQKGFLDDRNSDWNVSALLLW